jgi:Tfp pilus assembly protein PilF
VRITPAESQRPGVQAFRQRALIRVDPVLLLMTPEGDILHRQYTRLYPAYDAQGGAFPDWPETLLTAEDLLALVRRVAAERTQREEEVRRLQETEGAAAAIALASIYRSRGRPERARDALRALLDSEPSVEAREALADLLDAMGSPDEARAEYEALLRSDAGHERADQWRYDVERLRLTTGWAAAPATASDADDPVAVLRRLAETVSDEELAARIQLTLVKAARIRGKEDDFRAGLAWLAERVGTEENVDVPKWTAPTLYLLLEVELMAGRAWRRRAEASGWQLVRTWPESTEAQLAKHGMLGAAFRTGPGVLRTD